MLSKLFILKWSHLFLSTVNALPLPQSSARDILARAKSYSIINVDGGTTSAAPISIVTVVETRTIEITESASMIQATGPIVVVAIDSPTTTVNMINITTTVHVNSPAITSEVSGLITSAEVALSTAAAEVSDLTPLVPSEPISTSVPSFTASTPSSFNAEGSESRLAAPNSRSTPVVSISASDKVLDFSGALEPTITTVAGSVYTESSKASTSTAWASFNPNNNLTASLSTNSLSMATLVALSSPVSARLRTMSIVNADGSS